MLNPAEARRQILASVPDFPAETVGMSDAVGRILRQPVIAERDQPPFDRVTMDGIAVSSAALQAGRRSFRIAATRHAGDPAGSLDDRDSCMEVMTGAVLPPGSDTVIPVERIEISDGHASVEPGYRPEQGQFIHRQGSDHAAGTEVLASGSEIAPVDVAIIASCGLPSVQVARAPEVRIISTGNELVPAGAPIEAHQIRLSNGPSLAAMLASQGFARCRHDHLPDDPDKLEGRIRKHLNEADVLVLSGGVSMGKADFVPQVLSRLGVEVVFHRISQRPGKPMWFGNGPRGQAVFALPGNPVSSLVCCRQYVLPALLHASGRAAAEPAWAVLREAFEFRPKLTCFLPVSVSSDDQGRLLALARPTNTSGDFTALGGTDGYVELDADRDRFAQGEVVPFHAWQRP